MIWCDDMDKKDLAVMFSKKSDHWSTPKDLYNLFVDKLGYYDPNPLYANSFDFKPRDMNMFINPPYSDIKTWVDYAINNHYMFHRRMLLLVPSRTDTIWFHKLLDYGCIFYFFKGRLKFGDGKGSAPFPSVLVELRNTEQSSIKRYNMV